MSNNPIFSLRSRSLRDLETSSTDFERGGEAPLTLRAQHPSKRRTFWENLEFDICAVLLIVGLAGCSTVLAAHFGA
jgi:hypothetical protein